MNNIRVPLDFIKTREIKVIKPIDRTNEDILKLSQIQSMTFPIEEINGNIHVYDLFETYCTQMEFWSKGGGSSGDKFKIFARGIEKFENLTYLKDNHAFKNLFEYYIEIDLIDITCSTKNLSHLKEDEELIKPLKKFGLKISKKDKEVRFQRINSKLILDNDILLVFHVHTTGSDPSICPFIFRFANANRIIKIATDFGSEATQVAFKNMNMKDVSLPQKIDITKTLTEMTYSELKNMSKDMIRKNFNNTNKSKYNSQDQNIDKNNTSIENSSEGMRDLEATRIVVFVNNLKKKMHEILQYDNSNRYLFRTLFYLKKNLSNDFELKKPSLFSDIAMVTNNQIDYAYEYNYLIIPNLKILSLAGKSHFQHEKFSVIGSVKGNSNEFSMSVGDTSIRNQIRSALLNNLLLASVNYVKSFLDYDKITIKSSKPLYLDLKYLIPNIYTPEDINTIINGIREFFLHSKSEKNESILLNIKDINISTISESDASFLGWVNEIEMPTPPGHYLIIDSGKGTTDISIIKKGVSNDEISSIYRSGFVGGGQYITNAVFFALAHQAGLDLNLLVSNIVGKDTGLMMKIVKILNFVDEYKKGGSISSLEEILEASFFDEKKDISRNLNESLNATKSINYKGEPIKEQPELNLNFDTYIEDIIKFIIQNDEITDSLGFVNQACKDITEELINSVTGIIKDNRFEKVILTGRNFMFKPLKELTEKVLIENLTLDSNAVFFTTDPIKAKGWCIDGTLSHLNCNYGTNLAGSVVIKRKSDFEYLGIDFSRILTKSFKRENTSIITELVEINKDVLVGLPIKLLKNKTLKPTTVFSINNSIYRPHISNYYNEKFEIALDKDSDSSFNILVKDEEPISINSSPINRQLNTDMERYDRMIKLSLFPTSGNINDVINKLWITLKNKGISKKAENGKS